MAASWYQSVPAETPLTQGDIVLDCPLLAWASNVHDDAASPETARLLAATRCIRADVIVMTQACDLEHQKVSEVILCPHVPASEYRRYWEEEMRSRNQNPTAKAWRAHASDIADGYLWNLTVLNAASTEDLHTEHRIVDFHEVFTAPRAFLESLLRYRGQPRLRLLAPYREHVSQAFARFFMRVGLPVEVDPLP